MRTAIDRFVDEVLTPAGGLPLAAQARRLRADYPQLFEHLRDRDATLRRLIGRVPSPAEIESCVGYDMRRDLLTPLTRLETGLEELVSE